MRAILRKQMKKEKTIKFCMTIAWLFHSHFSKKLEWSPFEKVGELTLDGVAFIKKHIGIKEPGFYFDNV